jgi:hypothetical protein
LRLALGKEKEILFIQGLITFFSQKNKSVSTVNFAVSAMLLCKST